MDLRRRKTMPTWSSVRCARTAASCCAATIVRLRITSSVFSRRSQRSPTAAGIALAARSVVALLTVVLSVHLVGWLSGRTSAQW